MTAEQRSITWPELGAVGLLQGAVLWQVERHWPKEASAQTPWAALAACAIVFGLAYELAWTGRHRLRLIVLSALLAGLYALLSIWVWGQVRDAHSSDDIRIVSFFLAGTAALYALGPYVQIFQERGNLLIPYERLFLHSWNNVFIVLVAAVFAGVFWGLLCLWAEMFALIKIKFFRELFYKAPFAWISLAGSFGVGVALARENERIILALRSIVLSLCRFLLPLLATIAALFLGSLLFTGLRPLWATRIASTLLMGLAGTGILFVNGVVQDRIEGFPYPVALRRFVEASLFMLPVLAALAAYAIALRVGQYGLTPARFWGIVVIAIVTLYAFGYAGALILHRTGWPLGLQRVNVAVSVAIISVGIGTHTPLLDPLRLSARNQFDRLARGKVRASEFDFGALGFQLGRVGWERLEALTKLTRHPEIAEIVKEVRLVESVGSSGEWLNLRGKPLRRILADGDLAVFPPGTRIPEDLRAAISQDRGIPGATRCAETRECALMAIILDDDPEPEFLLATDRFELALYDRETGGVWRGRALNIEGGRILGDEYDARVAIRKGRVDVARPRYPRLRIGEGLWTVHE